MDEKTYQELLLENETLKKENHALRIERDHYRNLHQPNKESKVHVEEKVEMAKAAAKIGLNISKDFFKTTKTVFGVAKDSFKQEWERNKTQSQVEETELGSVVYDESFVPFSYIKKADEPLISVLSQEDPLTVSLVLYHLPHEICSEALSNLDVSLRVDVSEILGNPEPIKNLDSVEIKRIHVLIKQKMIEA